MLTFQQNIFFILMATVIFYLIPAQFRSKWLLFVSGLFYFFISPQSLVLTLILIFINYFLCRAFATRNAHSKKLFWISIGINLIILFCFKCFVFMKTSILFPMGLSFIVFHALSYNIDLYQGKINTPHRFFNLSLYLLFFPKLLAGPIEKPNYFISQICTQTQFDRHRFTDGLKLIALGFFKKMVIADRLALFVNPVFDHPIEYQGVSFFAATIYFTLQIYFDFSAYSDIAIGTGQLFGYNLTTNFNRPYTSLSVREFWQRWHISLYHWFRDYIYLPLGGSRVSQPRLYLNILIVFVLSGIWHGNSLTFLAWGLINGTFVLLSLSKTRSPVKPGAGLIGLGFRFGTFCVIGFSWIFFRVNTLSDATYILNHFFTGWGEFLSKLCNNFSQLGQGGGVFSPFLMGRPLSELVLALTGCAAITILYRWGIDESTRHILCTKHPIVRWTGYYFLILGILMFGVTQKSDFIYYNY